MNNAAANSTVTVAIVEDDRRFSRGLMKAVRETRQLRCAGLCQTRAEAIAKLPVWQPDIVLLDLDLGTGRDGIDILPELVRQLPHTQFLVLTVVANPEAIFHAVQRGAHGYLLKSLSLSELPSEILEAHQGHPRLSPEVLCLMLDALRNSPPCTNEQNKLSPREVEIMELLAQGFERKEIAARLILSAETVKTHIRNIHEKLRVSTTQQAVQKVYPSKRLRLLPRWISGGKPI